MAGFRPNSISESVLPVDIQSAAFQVAAMVMMGQTAETVKGQISGLSNVSGIVPTVNTSSVDALGTAYRKLAQNINDVAGTVGSTDKLIARLGRLNELMNDLVSGKGLRGGMANWDIIRRQILDTQKQIEKINAELSRLGSRQIHMPTLGLPPIQQQRGQLGLPPAQPQPRVIAASPGFQNRAFAIGPQLSDMPGYVKSRFRYTGGTVPLLMPRGPQLPGTMSAGQINALYNMASGGKQTIGAEELAQLLGVSPSTVRTMARNAGLARQGNAYAFTREQVMALMPASQTALPSVSHKPFGYRQTPVMNIPSGTVLTPGMAGVRPGMPPPAPRTSVPLKPFISASTPENRALFMARTRGGTIGWATPRPATPGWASPQIAEALYGMSVGGKQTVGLNEAAEMLGVTPMQLKHQARAAGIGKTNGSWVFDVAQLQHIAGVNYRPPIPVPPPPPQTAEGASQPTALPKRQGPAVKARLAAQRQASAGGAAGVVPGPIPGQGSYQGWAVPWGSAWSPGAPGAPPIPANAAAVAHAQQMGWGNQPQTGAGTSQYGHLIAQAIIQNAQTGGGGGGTFTVAQAAANLGVTPQTVRNRAQKLGIPKQGNTWAFTPAQLAALGGAGGGGAAGGGAGGGGAAGGGGGGGTPPNNFLGGQGPLPGGFGGMSPWDQNRAMRQYHQQMGTTPLTQAFKTAAYRSLAYGVIGAVSYGGYSQIGTLIDNITQAEQKLVALKRVLNPLTTDFKAMKGAMFDLAEETGRSFTESGDVMFAFAKQGKSAADTIKLTKEALIMANIGEMDSATAVQTLTSLLAQFNLTADDAGGIVDKLNNVSNKNAVGFQTLAESVQQAGAAFKNQGGSFDDMIAIMAAMSTTTQWSGSRIGRGARQIMSRMAGSEFQSAMQRIGVPLTDTSGMKLGPKEVLGGLSQKWGTLGSTERLKISQLAGGGIYYSAFQSLMNGWQLTGKAFQDSKNAELSAYKENEEYMKSYVAKLNQTKAAWAEFAQAIGDAGLLDSLKWLAQASKSIADSELARGVGGAVVSPTGMGITTALLAGGGIAEFMKLSGQSPTQAYKILLGQGKSAQEALQGAEMVARQGVAGQAVQLMRMKVMGQNYQPAFGTAGGMEAARELAKQMGASIKGSPHMVIIGAVLLALAASFLGLKHHVDNIKKDWKESDSASTKFKFAVGDVAESLDAVAKAETLDEIVLSETGLMKAYKTAQDDAEKLSKTTVGLPKEYADIINSQAQNNMQRVGLRTNDKGQVEVWDEKTGAYVAPDTYRSMPKEEQERIATQLRTRAARVTLENEQMGAWASWSRYVKGGDWKDPFLRGEWKTDIGKSPERFIMGPDQASKKLSSQLKWMEGNTAISFASLRMLRQNWDRWQSEALQKGGPDFDKSKINTEYGLGIAKINEQESKLREEYLRMAKSAVDAGMSPEEAANRLSMEYTGKKDAKGQDIYLVNNTLKDYLLQQLSTFKKTSDIVADYEANVGDLNKAIKDATREYEKHVALLQKQAALLKLNTTLFGLNESKRTEYANLRQSGDAVVGLEERLAKEGVISKELTQTLNSLLGANGSVKDPDKNSMLGRARQDLENAQVELGRAKVGTPEYTAAQNAVKESSDRIAELEKSAETYQDQLEDAEKRTAEWETKIAEEKSKQLDSINRILEKELGLVGTSETLSEVLKNITSDLHRFALAVIQLETQVGLKGTQRMVFAGVNNPASEYADRSDDLYMQQIRDRFSFIEQQYTHYMTQAKTSEYAKLAMEAKKQAASSWIEHSKNRVFAQYGNVFTWGNNNYSDLFLSKDGQRLTRDEVMSNLDRMGGAVGIDGASPYGTARQGFMQNLYKPLDTSRGAKQNIGDLWQRYLRVYNMASQAGIPVTDQSWLGKRGISNDIFSSRLGTPRNMYDLMQQWAKENPSAIGGSKAQINEWYGKYLNYMSSAIEGQFQFIVQQMDKTGVFKEMDDKLMKLANDPALLYERQWQEGMANVSEAMRYNTQGMLQWQSEYIKANYQVLFAEIITDLRKATNEAIRGAEELYINRFISRGTAGFMHGARGRAGIRPGISGYTGIYGPMAEDATSAIKAQEDAYKKAVSDIYRARQKAMEIARMAGMNGYNPTQDLMQVWADIQRAIANGMNILKKIQKDVEDAVILGYADTLEKAVNAILSSINSVSSSRGYNNLYNILSAARGGMVEGNMVSASGIVETTTQALNDAMGQYMTMAKAVYEIEKMIASTTSDQVDYREKLNKALAWYNTEMEKASKTIGDIAAAELFTASQRRVFDALNAVNQMSIGMSQQSRANAMLNPLLNQAIGMSGVTPMGASYISINERILAQSQEQMSAIQKLLEELVNGTIGYDDAAKIAGRLIPGIGVAPGGDVRAGLVQALAQAMVDVNNKQLTAQNDTVANGIVSSFAELLVTGQAGGLTGIAKVGGFYNEAAKNVGMNILKYGSAGAKEALLRVRYGESAASAAMGLSGAEAAAITKFGDYLTKGRAAADIERFAEMSINAPTSINGRMLSAADVMRLSGASINMEGAAPADRLVDSLDSLRGSVGDLINAIIGLDGSVSGNVTLGYTALPNALVPNIAGLPLGAPPDGLIDPLARPNNVGMPNPLAAPGLPDYREYMNKLANSINVEFPRLSAAIESMNAKNSGASGSVVSPLNTTYGARASVDPQIIGTFNMPVVGVQIPTVGGRGDVSEGVQGGASLPWFLTR